MDRVPVFPPLECPGQQDRQRQGGDGQGHQVEDGHHCRARQVRGKVREIGEKGEDLKRAGCGARRAESECGVPSAGTMAWASWGVASEVYVLFTFVVALILI